VLSACAAVATATVSATITTAANAGGLVIVRLSRSGRVDTRVVKRFHLDAPFPSRIARGEKSTVNSIGKRQAGR
jgi:hypothetical protein